MNEQTLKAPASSLERLVRPLDEAKNMALLNVIKCTEHVLRRIGAPEDTIKGFLDGDCEHVIWWVDTQWPNGVLDRTLDKSKPASPDDKAT